MISISTRTTLCVVAACLLQNVSASTLQNPCVMQKIESTPTEEMMSSNWVDTPMFICELQGIDSELVEGIDGVSGSEITVEIKSEDVLVLLAQMESLELNGSEDVGLLLANMKKFGLEGLTVFAQGLALDSSNRLFFPEGAEIVFGSEETRRRLSNDRDGSHSVLVVRVLVDDMAMHSAATLSDKVFGTDGDINNLSERFRSCSYGKLLMEPTQEAMASAADGVVDITVEMEITPSVTTSESVVNAVKAQLGDLVGGPDVRIKDTFRHVIMCLPKGTVLGEGGNPRWVAYTYTGGCSSSNCGWLAVVNHDYCQSTSTLGHEISHNLGLQHSGRLLTGNDYDQYRDQTGLLGFSDASDDTKMCFNAPKSYQTGWYADRDITLARSSLSLAHTIYNPWTASLVGITDYENVSGDEKITVKLDDGDATNLQYYIGFNRKTGINADTKGPGDKVIVTSQDPAGQSWLLAELAELQAFDITDYFGSGKDARIQYLGVTNGEPRRAEIAIYPLASCSKYEYEFGLDLTTDDNAAETSWDLRNAAGEIVLAGSGYHSEKAYAVVECLPPGNYIFNMMDSASNGIDADKGGYTITLEGRVVGSGDEFLTPVNSHTFEAGCQDSLLSLFEIDLSEATAGEATSWQVTDDAGTVITSGLGSTSAATSDYARFCLPDGNYVFTIIDDEHGDGSYTAYNQKQPIEAGDFVVDLGAPFVDPTLCQDDISLVDQIGAGNYNSLPIKIVSQDITSVTIDVYNTWDGDILSNMFTRFDDTTLKTTCPEMTDVTKTAAPSRYTIACMSKDAVAHVDLFVSKPSFSTKSGDIAEVPECCHPNGDFTEPAVQYVFMLQCISQCPTEGVQRGLLRGSSH